MFADIPSGAKCFIDSNIFFYHLAAVITDVSLSNACSDFFKRVSDGEVVAMTSTVAVAEATHKLMLAEAKVRFDPKLNAGRLQQQRHLFASLAQHKQVAELIRALQIHVEPVTPGVVGKSCGLLNSASAFDKRCVDCGCNGEIATDGYCHQRWRF